MCYHLGFQNNERLRNIIMYGSIELDITFILQHLSCERSLVYIMFKRQERGGK